MNVYDFDKTIYKNDSSFDFFFFCLRRHGKIFTILPSVAISFLKYYVFRKITKTQFKEKAMAFVKYVDLEKDLADFWKLNIDKIKDFYLENQKTDDVIISASPEFLLTPVCKELGIKHLIASRVSTKDGSFEGLNCHDEEKVRRFYEVFPNGKVDEFYSDSYSDTPMAKLAEKAYIIKGDKLSSWKL